MASIAAIGSAASADPAHAHFINRFEGKLVSGHLRLKVSSEKLLRPAGTKFAIYVGDTVLETAAEVPWDLEFDTTKYSDGVVTLRLVILDRRMKPFGDPLDTLNLDLANRPPPPPKPVVPASSPQPADPKPAVPAAPAPEPRPWKLPVVTTTDAATAASVSAISSVPADVKFMRFSAGKLYFAVADSSIVLCDPVKKSGLRVKPLAANGAILSVVIDGGTVWWTCAGDQPYVAKAVYGYRDETKKLYTVDLSENTADWYGRLALSKQGVTLNGRQNAIILDGQGSISKLDAPVDLRETPMEEWQLEISGFSRKYVGTAAQDRYLGWNESGIQVLAIAGDGANAWLMTNRGLRRIEPGNPSSSNGYGGFVRISLGSDRDKPATSADQTLLASLNSFKGTPYRWGGESRGGVDCSGFTMLAFKSVGVNLPHQFQEIGRHRPGETVKGDIRFGDVLVTSGHVSTYIGGGRTIEAVEPAVGENNVWMEGPVTVRRFVGIQSAQPAFASRGAKPKRK